MTTHMLPRFFTLLLASSLLLLSRRASFAGSPTIEVVVPGYEYPGAFYTATAGIANNGTTIGYSSFGNFLRNADGEFSLLPDFPGAFYTDVYGVNSSNVVCGDYLLLSTYSYQGFLYDGTTFATYDVPLAPNTRINGLNDAGNFCGHYTGGYFENLELPFVNVDGSLITIEIPGAVNGYAMGINNLGQVVGYYDEGAQNPYKVRGFFRDSDGTLTYPLSFPGAVGTFPTGINDQGVIAGYYTTGVSSSHGFVLKLAPKGGIISYNYSDAGDGTAFGGINNSMLISGYYVNTYLTESFIAQLVR